MDWLKRNVSASAAIMFAVAVLYYLRPYYGIRHDSPLYLGQALLALDPSTFKQDLFFKYGSQADFTVLPGVLGWLCSYWHPAQVFLALTALSLFVFLAASYVLARWIFGPVWGYRGVLAVLIFPAVYAGHWIMSYSESFLTGRNLAEPFVLLFIFAYLERKYWWSAGLFILAALIHPLPALGGLIVVWLHLSIQHRIWVHLLWLPVGLFLAALAGVPQFGFLGARFDPEWFEWVKGPNKLTFIESWTLTDWIVILTDTFLVGLLSRRAPARARPLAQAAILATVLGLVLSYLFYEQLRFVFLGGLQFWRIHWILHWVAMVSIPFLLAEQWRRTGLKSVDFLALLTIIALCTQNRISPEMGKILFVLMPLYLAWPRIQGRISPGYARALLYSMPLALMVAFFTFLRQAHERYHASWHFGTPLTVHYMLLSNPVIGGLVTVTVIYLFVRFPKWRWMAALMALAALIFSISFWDRRSEWTLELEQTHGDGREFGIVLEPNAKVFWSNELLAPWLVLRRPSYFSTQQTAGILFNRETAREVMKRNADLDALNTSLEACKSKKTLSNEIGVETCNIEGVAISALCRIAKSDLDYVVLDFKSDERHAGEWHLKGHDILGKPINYFIYRCADLLAASAPSGS